jgi:hypothetical protein
MSIPKRLWDAQRIKVDGDRTSVMNRHGMIESYFNMVYGIWSFWAPTVLALKTYKKDDEHACS